MIWNSNKIQVSARLKWTEINRFIYGCIPVSSIIYLVLSLLANLHWLLEQISLCEQSVKTYFLKVELLIHALIGSCGDFALTIEAQRNLMELRHSPILVMWLDGPGTFVLLHPSICVGWTDPSQGSPNSLFASALSIYLLYPCCRSFLTLVNLLIFRYPINLVKMINVYFYFVWFCFLSGS